MRNDESHVTAGHGFDSAAFFVSPENTFLHRSVSGFFSARTEVFRICLYLYGKR